tara:strand:+ start:280 stop:696 length:417 start_codon:yes stop_codon:yes gene_type:complete
MDNMSLPSRADIINDAADAIKAIAQSIKSDVSEPPKPVVDDDTLTAAFRAGANHILDLMNDERFSDTVNVSVESDEECNDCSITVNFDPVNQLIGYAGQIQYVERLGRDVEEVKAALNDWLPKSEEPTATTDNTETPA